MMKCLGRDYLDKDALAVIDAIYDRLSPNWQLSVAGDCEAGEEFWGVENALSGAYFENLQVDQEILDKAEVIAGYFDEKYHDRVMDFVEKLTSRNLQAA